MMGSCFSHPDSRTSTKIRRRRLSNDIMDTFEIDHRPMYVDGFYYIAIQPQGLVLQFKVNQSGHVFLFRLSKVQHTLRCKDEVNIVSDQILTPFAGLCGLDPDNAILQFWRNKEHHTRTLVSQYQKIWAITGQSLKVWPTSADSISWIVQVSDPARWQSYNCYE